ncbi:heavy metal-binding domain-containing protein [Marinospirillum insulare]|uniref:PDZ domain-containing protein n=1 Tax=Marinospirillum insulare TaxID=217169 RepID=A0ABQ5ZWV0_9GAMM|nr:heavy metal-binding domain-containing protein [Marinospirillum insulare]GLR63941.1 hypothetical protein GCM10007878_13790 [Marinospirillum insulare]
MNAIRVVDIVDHHANGAKAGIEVGDTLVKANEFSLESVNDLTSFMSSYTNKPECIITLLNKKGDVSLVRLPVGALGLSLVPVEIENNFNEFLYEDFIKTNKELINKIEIDSALISTASTLEGYKIEEHFGVITYQRFVSSKENTNDISIFNLKRQALEKGANAVIGVNFNFISDVSGGESYTSTSITLHISGTAVRVKKIQPNED